MEVEISAAFAAAELTSPGVGCTQPQSWALRVVRAGKPLTLLLFLQRSAFVLKIMAVSGNRNLENHPDTLEFKRRFCYASALTLLYEPKLFMLHF